jgi:hypothetical protein
MRNRQHLLTLLSSRSIDKKWRQLTVLEVTELKWIVPVGQSIKSSGGPQIQIQAEPFLLVSPAKPKNENEKKYGVTKRQTKRLGRLYT